MSPIVPAPIVAPAAEVVDKVKVFKVEIGLAKGKKQHDKRATEQDKDWKREQGRLLKERQR